MSCPVHSNAHEESLSLCCQWSLSPAHISVPPYPPSPNAHEDATTPSPSLILTAPFSGADLREGRGTLCWCGPEILKLSSKPNKASDVYSFGVFMWEVATCQLPYSGHTDEQVSARICGLKEEDEHPLMTKQREQLELEMRTLGSTCVINGEEYTDLERSCLHINPSQRPDFDYIVSVLECIMDKLS